jgi:hypothetical protein
LPALQRSRQSLLNLIAVKALADTRSIPSQRLEAGAAHSHLSPD